MAGGGARVYEAAREALRDALAVALPTECSGCGRLDRPVCRQCRRALVPSVRRVAVGARRLPLWYGLDYDSVARRVLLAFKDSGRTDSGPVLAEVLTAVLEQVAREAGGRRLTLVTIPSTRRAFVRRGYRPVDEVVRRCGVRHVRMLRVSRQTRDQSGLGAREREANRHGSLQARYPLTGRGIVIVDDIVTSGATVDEAARAIGAAGGRVFGVAAIARTPRRDAAQILPVQHAKVAGDFDAGDR